MKENIPVTPGGIESTVFRMTLYIHRNQAPGTIAVVCIFIDALIPAFAPADHLGWMRWRMPLVIFAVIALIALITQLFILSRQEHERETKEQERDKRHERIEDILTSIQVSSSKMEVPLENEASKNARAPFSPREHLQQAQEAVWIQDAVKLPVDELKINIAHDLDFRHKFYNTPRGNAQFDALRDSIAKDPIIAARMVRSRLVPRQPFAQQIREVFSLMNKPFTSISDFLFEMNLVNVTDNPTTVDRITAEAELDGKWTTLNMADLSNYELAFDDEEPSGVLIDLSARIEQLPSLWDQLKGVSLTRGIAKQGWVDFAVDMPSSQLDKPVQHRVRIVDALGGIHPVLVLESKPLDLTGRIKHSKKVYATLRS